MDTNSNKKNLLPSLLSVVLALVLVVGTIPLSVLASTQDQADVSLGSSINLGNSDGRDLEEVKISSEKELRELATKVNNGDSMKDNLVLLTKDIHLESEELWIPIGIDAEKPFSGHFDGQGHTVSGFRVDPEVNGGLFGYLYNANIRNIAIKNYTAKNSTSGLFFHAYKTTVSLAKVEENGTMTGFALSGRSMRAFPWDGTSDIGWYGPGPSNPSPQYLIATPEELAGLAELVNDGTDDFTGATIIIEGEIDLNKKHWTPIGLTSPTKPPVPAPPLVPAKAFAFKGNVVGQGAIIKGLRIEHKATTPAIMNSGIETAGLFGYAEEASFSNLTLESPFVNLDGGVGALQDSYAGALLGAGIGVDIKNITIRNPEVSFSGTFFPARALSSGGIVGTLLKSRALGSTSNISPEDSLSSIQNCLVITPNVSGGIVGGLVGISNALYISDSVVYGGDFTANTEAGGIFGSSFSSSNATTSTYTNLLSFGNILQSPPDTSSGLGNISFNTALANSMVTQYSHQDSAVFATLNGASSGINYNFTDAHFDTTTKLINNKNSAPANSLYTISNYYDNMTSPGSGSNLIGENFGMATSLLTNKGINPNPGAWTLMSGHYPINTALLNSSNDEIKILAGLASVAVTPLDPEDSYTDGSGIKLMDKTANGDSISWISADLNMLTGTPDPDIDGGKIYTNKNNASITLSLTAKVGGYEKTFEDITVNDTFLEENIDQREPAFPLKVSGIETLQLTHVFKRMFIDDIVYNPDVAGLITLHTVDKAGTISPAVQAITAGQVQPGEFEISSNKKEVAVTFNLSEDTHYLIRFPEGMVMEDGKTNLSEGYEVEFLTPSFSQPVIEYPLDKNLNFYVEQGITEKELLEDIVVWEDSNKSVKIPFDVTHKLIDPNWDPKDVSGSAENALQNTSPGFFPNGQNTARYILNEPQIMTDPKPGAYSLIIMAKNENGKTSTRSVSFSIIGKPDWIHAPKTAVHIPWTRNGQAIIDAAQQGALAATEHTNAANETVSTPAVIVPSFSMDHLNAITTQNGGPAKIVITLQVLDQTGKVSGLTETVTVYLDRDLKYTMTPSPVTMSKATKRQVEERMNVVARNFSHDIIEYDHWNNEYRKPGLYYIDITSEPQGVTYCTDKNCPDISKHPYDTLDDTFILNLIDTPGAEHATAWGEATAQAEEDVYSQNITKIKPTTYTLPKFVPEGLLNQEYGRMELNYGNEYRWNLYSNTLDDSYKWNDVYSLQVRAGEDSRVSALLDNPAAAAQFEFAHVGRLFGTVEFDLNIIKARESFTALPDENLGLYKYNPTTNSLDLVSDVIITEGTWASSTLNELYPATYVLKSRGEGDKIIPPLEREIADYFISLREKKAGSNEIIDPNPTIINTFEHETMYDSMYELIEKPLVDTTKTIGNLWPLVALAVVVLAASGYFVYRRGTKKEEQ